MIKNIVLAFAVVSIIILFSGCTTNNICLPGMQCKKTIEENPDVVIIKEIKVSPSTKINFGDEVELYVTIKNKDERNSVRVKYLGIENSGSFTCKICEEKTFNLFPLQEKTFKLTLTAPNYNGTMHITQTLEVKVQYEYTSQTREEVYLIGQDLYKEYLSSNEPIPIHPSSSLSKGPLRILLSLEAKQPIVLTSDGKHVNLYVDMFNDCDGIIKEFESFILKINCPGESTEYRDALKFKGDGFDTDIFSLDTYQKITTKNTQEIVFFGKQSPRYNFVLEAKGNENLPIISCDILTSAKYIYETSKAITFTVGP